MACHDFGRSNDQPHWRGPTKPWPDICRTWRSCFWALTSFVIVDSFSLSVSRLQSGSWLPRGPEVWKGLRDELSNQNVSASHLMTRAARMSSPAADKAAGNMESHRTHRLSKQNERTLANDRPKLSSKACFLKLSHCHCRQTPALPSWKLTRKPSQIFPHHYTKSNWSGTPDNRTRNNYSCSLAGHFSVDLRWRPLDQWGLLLIPPFVASPRHCIS